MSSHFIFKTSLGGCFQYSTAHFADEDPEALRSEYLPISPLSKCCSQDFKPGSVTTWPMHMHLALMFDFFPICFSRRKFLIKFKFTLMKRMIYQKIFFLIWLSFGGIFFHFPISNSGPLAGTIIPLSLCTIDCSLGIFINVPYVCL